MKYDKEVERLEKYWDGIPSELRQVRISQALREVAAEKDAEYAGVVKAYKARLEVVESGMSKEIRSLLEAIAEAPHSVGCAKEMHPSFEAPCDCWKSEAIPASLKGVAASLPSSQVMPGEITCAPSESKTQDGRE